MPVPNKEFLNIQAATECTFTLKRESDMIITHSLYSVYGAGVEGWVTVNFNIPTRSFTLKLLITFVFQHFLTKRLRHNPHMLELLLLELIRRYYKEEDAFNL